jgi:hypothetical protein
MKKSHAEPRHRWKGNIKVVLMELRSDDTDEMELKKVGFRDDKTYEGVSKSFRTGRLERELQMIELSATRCSFIAIL